MTVMQMAKAAFHNRFATDPWFLDTSANFENFAALVRADERERIIGIIKAKLEFEKKGGVK